MDFLPLKSTFLRVPCRCTRSGSSYLSVEPHLHSQWKISYCKIIQTLIIVAWSIVTSMLDWKVSLFSLFRPVDHGLNILCWWSLLQHFFVGCVRLVGLEP